MIRELIVKEYPKSPISEIFRTLRTNIQFMNNKNKLKSLLITSTLPGEGKSWVSANLAVTFAQAGKKVIVLDADMRKGRQYRIFNVSPRPGLSNYLSGVTDNDKEVDLADYLQETEVENLYVIPAGNVPPNPSELLVSESMINLIESLKNICDVVIVDGPPTQLVTDSLILTRIIDSTVIVAESNQTKKENLRRIIDNIQKVGGKIAGVVLNKIQLSAKKYEQSYYYGSTAIATKDKNKRTKTNKATASRNESSLEIKNRNTERARQLVNQNRKKEALLEEKQKYKENEEDFNAKLNAIQKDNNSNEELNNKTIINDNSNGELNEQIIEENRFNKELDRQITENNNLDKEQNKQVLENNNYISIDENPNSEIYELDEKTRDILRQVNEYIENERNNLN